MYCTTVYCSIVMKLNQTKIPYSLGNYFLVLFNQEINGKRELSERGNFNRRESFLEILIALFYDSLSD